MSPEAEQPVAPVQETAAAAPAAAPAAPAAGNAARRRPAGVPVWRTGKPDAFLAAAVDIARTALEGITAAADIGPHVAAKSEGDRLVTHLFESKLAGYVGWQWYAVLTRNSRSKVITVSELGLLPSEHSILAPEWVPWAERVRPEDEQPLDDEAAETEGADQEAAGQEGPVQEDSGTPAITAQDVAESDADSSVAGSDAADADYADGVGQPAGHDDGTN